MILVYIQLTFIDVGCHSYSVPEHVREHIDLIKPTVHFNHRPTPNSLKRRAGPNLGAPSIFTGPKKASKGVKITPALQNCDQFITPDCLRALYAIDYKPVATAKNTYGIGKIRHGNDKSYSSIKISSRIHAPIFP